VSEKVKNRVLFQSRRLSIYLVRYSAGHAIVPHVDMVSEGRLYKLNCVLIKPASLPAPGVKDRARASLAAELCPDPSLSVS